MVVGFSCLLPEREEQGKSLNLGSKQEYDNLLYYLGKNVQTMAVLFDINKGNDNAL